MAYTISFDTGWGGTAPTSISVEGGVAIGDVLPRVTRSGYHFIGWFEPSAEYGWNLVTPESSFSADTELTARWVFKSDSLLHYYPEGNVQSDSHVTSSLRFQYNSDGTAYVLPFSMKTGSEAGDSNADAEGDVVIPFEVEYEGDAYTVNRIGGWASDVTKSAISKMNAAMTVTAPITVVDIGRLACCKRNGLSAFSFPYVESVQSFALSTIGITSAYLPRLLRFYGLDSLAGCLSLESVSLPSLVSVGGGFCSGDASLVSLSLPMLDSTGVGNFFCQFCTGLKSVTFPSLSGSPAGIFNYSEFDAISLPLATGPYVFAVSTFYKQNHFKIYHWQSTLTTSGNGFADVNGNATICLREDMTVNGVSYPAETIALDGVSVPIEWYNYNTAPKFAVSFDNLGGDGPALPVTATYGYDLPSVQVPTRANFDFGGYYTGTDGIGIMYYDTQGVSARKWDWLEGKSLYAKWVPHETVVTFEANSGEDVVTVTPSTMSVTYGEPYGTLPVVSSRSGHTFVGWWTAPVGGALITSATIADNEGDRTIYAHWTASQTDVSFDMDGGTGGTSGVTAEYGSVMPTIVPPTKHGYDFAGYWSMEEGLRVKQYYLADGTSAAEWDETSETGTLYAYWNPAWTVTVEYENTGGEPVPSETVTFGNSLYPPPPEFYPPVGYKTFEYWDFGGTECSPNSPVSSADLFADVTEDGQTVKFIGVWEPIEYTIQFDANGGTGSMDSIAANYDEGTILPENEFEKDGKVFAGWNTADDGIGDFFADKAAVKNLSSTDNATVTLYAMWEDRVDVPQYEQYEIPSAGGAAEDEVGEQPAVSLPVGEDVTLAVSPNQIVSRTYEGITYEIHLRTFREVMYADVRVNGNVVSLGVRCLPDTWIVPNLADAPFGSGNFMFKTDGGAYPYYTDFGTTCRLMFFKMDEIATIEGD